MANVIAPQGSVIQINEGYTNEEWVGALMIVDEVREWGVMAYMRVPFKGITYLRVNHGQYDLIGIASFVRANEDDEANDEG